MCFGVASFSLPCAAQLSKRREPLTIGSPMKTMNRRRLALALAHGLGAAGLMATAVQAQQTAQRVEKIEVTGSDIKRIDTETPSPVQIITRDQIQQSGQRDIAELLRTVSAMRAGRIQHTSSG